MPAHSMPDWVSNPYRVVDSVFDASPASYRSNPESFRREIASVFRNKIFSGKDDYRYFLSSVNRLMQSSKNIPFGTLVHYRCMIQSEKSPSYHQPFVNIRNTESGDVRTVCALFKDHVPLGEQDECLAALADPRNFFLVQPFKCVPVPGEMEWIYGQEGSHEILSSIAAPAITAHFFGDAAENCKLNEEYDLFGIMYGNQPASPDSAEPHPLHMNVCFAEKRKHSHPGMPSEPAELSAAFVELSYVRPILLESLRGFVQGDIVAAEYLLLHLLSSTYSSRDDLPIGNFSLNLTNFPDDRAFSTLLKGFISKIVPKMKWLPIDIVTLNTTRMCPKLDVESDQDQELIAGLLQLTANTHLILDETTMNSGTLNETGVKNLLALQQLVKEQKMDIDYFTQHVEFSMDIPVLILSQGRSLIECRYLLPSKPDHSYAETILPEDTIKLVRKYLVAARFCAYDIGENMRKEIVEEFVEKRRIDRSLSGNLLHNQLELARYLCISHAETSLTSVRWNHVQMLEKERYDRTRTIS